MDKQEKYQSYRFTFMDFGKVKINKPKVINKPLHTDCCNCGNCKKIEVLNVKDFKF